MQDLETYAGTASRAGQRVVNSVAAQHPDWIMFSYDVSKAFAKGMTFEEIARLTGQPLRAVEFDLQPEDVPLIRKIPGFENFDPRTETLAMIKPIYGLKDAPRAWRKKLHIVLSSWGTSGETMRQLHAEAEIYTLHTYSASKTATTLDGRQKMSQLLDLEAAAQQEDGVKQVTMSTDKWLSSRKALLHLILTAHVDDLKGAARREVAKSLLDHLEKAFGPCKADYNRFVHTGIEHEKTERGVMCHQNGYIDNMKPLPTAGFSGLDDSTLVDVRTHELYRKLLGESAWTVMTRADMCVYIQALQRRGSAPRAVDCRRINLVCRYLKRHRVGIFYGKVPEPWRLVGFSDSAFKAQDDEAAGLALRGLAVVLTTDSATQPTSPSGDVNLLDFLTRRLRRVVRSTFAAELNALLDAIESMIITQLGWHQIVKGTVETIEQLLLRLEAGTLSPPIELVGYARSVFDAIAASDVCDPAEASLKLHLLSVRSRLAQGLVRALWWSDTRDMLADALTKGGIDRTSLLRCMDKGLFKMAHECVRTPKLVAGSAAK